MKKIKVLLITDHIASLSGVALEARNMVDGLVKTGRFQFVCLGGAIKHPQYNPQKFEEYGDDVVVYPVDGYGDQGTYRTIMRTERPDMIMIFTDPRFFVHLFAMANEIRPNLPIVYYHVWDNYPVPYFNKAYYDSNDVICTISKLTDNIVRTVSPNVECHYVPHSTNTEIYKPQPESNIEQFKKNSFRDKYSKDKFFVFWDNRNARRKQSGTLVFWFKDFLDKVGHDKATLVMHTDVKDPNGQDLEAIAEHLGLTNGEVIFSQGKLDDSTMAMMYNMADTTVSISDAEGHGRCVEPSAILIKEDLSTVLLKDVVVGEKVLSGDGTFRTVLNKSEPVSKKSLELNTFFQQKLKLSCDHKVFALKNGETVPNWYRADELREGDYVARNKSILISDIKKC